MRALIAGALLGIAVLILVLYIADQTLMSLGPPFGPAPEPQ